MSSTFKKAVRRQARLRAGLCGPSGSGKTYSALLFARGLVGPTGTIAVVDTERGSASLYSAVTDFDVSELGPPYTPARYIALIKEASTSYDALIIDSLSHAWAGEGGVLEMHDNATKADRSGNSYTAWRSVTPHHNALVDALLAAPCHVLCCLRSKTAYELVDDGKGKKKPIKIGLAPVQRDGMEYEFTLVFDVSIDSHIATASKDRTTLWNGRAETLTIAHGRELHDWLESGVNPVEASATLLDALVELVSVIDNTPHLTNWWRAHMDEINGLLPDDKLKLTKVCAERKEILLTEWKKKSSPVVVEEPIHA